MTELRPYQAKAVDEIEQALARHVLFVLPTGGGKTVVTAKIIENAVARSERVLVLSHRREITKQTSFKLSAIDLDHGIIQAGLTLDLDAPVQIASVQTFWSRCIRTDKIPLPHADLIVIDEAHHVRASMWAGILRSYPNARRLGLTATPCRSDGKGLGNYFDALIEGPSVAELTPKWLVPTIYYAPTEPDLKGVKVQAGDYQINQLASRMNRDDLVGDVIGTWFKFAEGRRAIAFACDVPHSRHIQEEFIRAGVACEHLDGGTPKPERDAILERLASGKTLVVVNCMVLTEGVDVPAASCIILARPTKQIGLYRQMAGRGLRPSPGKSNLVLIDHSGAVFRHGLLEDPIPWSLHTDKRAENLVHAKRELGVIGRLVECIKCSAMRTAGEACPHCGFLPQRRPDPVVFRDGEIARVNRQTRIANSVIDPNMRIRWHQQLAHIAGQRGYKPGWVAHKFKEKFGTWPAMRAVSPIEPSPEVLAWVRSRNIAWAKVQQKDRAG
jgi:DNA repair protein RadD